VVAWLNGGRDPLTQEHGSHREPARERLGEREQIGLDSGLLVRPERAGAAEPHLHLVEDQQRVRGVARLPQRGEEVRRYREYTPLALDRLDDHGRRAVGANGRGESARVPHLQKAHTGHQRPEGS
jgi:hypothetical protein